MTIAIMDDGFERARTPLTLGAIVVLAIGAGLAQSLASVFGDESRGPSVAERALVLPPEPAGGACVHEFGVMGSSSGGLRVARRGPMVVTQTLAGAAGRLEKAAVLVVVPGPGEGPVGTCVEAPAAPAPARAGDATEDGGAMEAWGLAWAALSRLWLTRFGV